MAQTSVLDRKVIQSGEKIFHQGEVANQAYLVQKGRVEIVRTADGKDTVLGAVGEGSILGEMALIDDAPRMASAVAVEMTTVLVITRAVFEEKLAKTDPFIRRLLKIFVDNIRNLSAKQAAPPPPPAPAEVAAVAAAPAAEAPAPAAAPAAGPTKKAGKP